MTLPYSRSGIRYELSLTPFALTPKIALNNFDSGNCSAILLEITFPTNISPGFTNVPTVTIPSSFKYLTSAELKLGIFLVVCSGISEFRSISILYLSIWIEVKISS